MKLLSQRDPAWAAMKLGASELTIGRFGCTTTCISMLSDYFGGYMSPPEIARHADWYTPAGLVLWPKMKFSKMKFVTRAYAENPDAIKYSLKDPDQAVMLQVNHQQHWVVAIKPTIFGNDWVIADPWTGKKCNAKATYHDVTGAAFFRRV